MSEIPGVADQLESKYVTWAEVVGKRLLWAAEGHQRGYISDGAFAVEVSNAISQLQNVEAHFPEDPAMTTSARLSWPQ